MAGFRARTNERFLDLSGGSIHKAEEYWEPVRAERGEVTLKQGEFYIMVTREYLRVPPSFAVEMVAYDIQSGEYRSHYAGFFDPGFGFGGEGEIKGTPAVLEVDPHEDVIIRHGQPICKMVYEHMVKGSGPTLRQRSVLQLPEPARASAGQAVHGLSALKATRDALNFAYFCFLQESLTSLTFV